MGGRRITVAEVSERLDATETTQVRIEKKIDDLAVRVEDIGLNGHKAALVSLAVAAPALIQLATAAPFLMDQRKRHEDDDVFWAGLKQRTRFLAEPWSLAKFIASAAGGVIVWQIVGHAFQTYFAHH